jgi:precorrin-3B methylase
VAGLAQLPEVRVRIVPALTALLAVAVQVAPPLLDDGVQLMTLLPTVQVFEVVDGVTSQIA